MKIALTQRGIGKLLLQVQQSAAVPVAVAANDARDNQSPTGINSINTVTVDQEH